MPVLYPPNASILNFFGSLKDSKEVKVTPRPVAGSNIKRNDSFSYEPVNFPLKSTQQLNIDWSKFENHIFFSSAEAKVTNTIDQIINKYPFDGTREEAETFFESQTGFDKWVFDQFPKYKGYIDFKNSVKITGTDQAGFDSPSLSRNLSGDSIINPKNSSFTFDFKVKIKSGSSNDNSVIFGKIKDSSNFLKITCNNNNNNKTKIALESVGGFEINDSSVDIDYDTWNHIVFVSSFVQGNDQTSEYKVSVYLNGVLQTFLNGTGQIESSKTYTVTSILDIDSSPIVFGGNFTGCIDEFRFFHEAINASQIKQYSKRSMFSTPSLKLYYRFNEPSGELILDSSGNSLHGKLSWVGSTSPRVQTSLSDNPLPLEKDDFSIILFPNHPSVISLSENLLKKAIEYDKENPNLITKLIPQHYLNIGSIQDNTNDLLDADKVVNYQYNEPGNPKQFAINSVQVITSFLYIWSRFFDEMKIYIDSFSTLNNFTYETEGAAPDNFLLNSLVQNGFFMPQLFNNSSLVQYLDGEDILDDISSNEYALKRIQAELTRRILLNLPRIIRSKGTHHSIETFLKSVGLNHRKSLRIREYGGPTNRRISQFREKKFDEIIMFSFNKTESDPEFKTNLFSGSGSTLVNFLSEDWTVECCFKFLNKDFAGEQNCFSIVSKDNDTTTELKLTIVERNKIRFSLPFGNYFDLVINDDSFFNEEIWKISFGAKKSATSALYDFFIRCGRQESGEDLKIYSLSKLSSRTYNQVFKYFLRIGLISDGDGNVNNLRSKIFGVRFWSKGITDQEFVEHVRNLKSVGTENAKENFLFYKKRGNSDIKEKLKFNFIGVLNEGTSTDGELILKDYSCNNHEAKISGLIDEVNYFNKTEVIHSQLSPYFDEAVTTNKIRIRGLKETNPLFDDPWVRPAPAHNFLSEDVPTDDNRLSIEFSVIDALNKDIINIFSTLEEMEIAIGSPELLYCPDYPDLEVLRNSYFEKLKDKINFKSFFEFFRWFDKSISRFIEQLVPRKTKFKGTNFVVESHVIERSKFEYESSEMYDGVTLNSSVYRNDFNVYDIIINERFGRGRD